MTALGRSGGGSVCETAPVGGWLVRRVASLVAVLVLVTAGAYALIDLLPGDPALAILGFGATEQRAEALRHQLELDRPWPVRYVHWVGDAVHGDLGQTRRYAPLSVAGVLRWRRLRWCRWQEWRFTIAASSDRVRDRRRTDEEPMRTG